LRETERGLDFYEPQHTWTKESQFVRVKLLEPHQAAALARTPKGSTMVSINCKDDFFFLGFFECLPRFCTRPIRIRYQGLDQYKLSRPPINIKCLGQLISSAKGEAQRKGRTQEELWEELEKKFGVLNDKADEESQSKPRQNTKRLNKTANNKMEIEVIVIDD
jgi:hypothetical protein